MAFRIFTLRVSAVDKRTGRPLEEEIEFVGTDIDGYSWGHMATGSFGSLLDCVLASTPPSTEEPTVDGQEDYWEIYHRAGVDRPELTAGLAIDRAAMIDAIDFWLSPDSKHAERGQPSQRYSVLHWERFAETKESEENPLAARLFAIREALDHGLAEIGLIPSLAVKQGKWSQKRQLAELGRRVRAGKTEAEAVARVLGGALASSTFQWSYRGPSLTALVWLELLLCVENDLYVRTCDLCGRWFAEPNSLVKACDLCRKLPEYSAVRQRALRKLPPTEHHKKRQAVQRHRMKVLRGKMTAIEFIKEHPDYKPRIGSELDKILRKAAMEMLESEDLTKEEYDRRFSVKRAGTTKTV